MTVPAFCSAPLLPNAHSTCRRIAAVSMRKGPSKKQRGPSKTPKDKQARMREIAKEYGIAPPEVGQSMDEQYNSPATKNNTQPITVYQRLAATFGVDTLERAEQTVYVVLFILLILFLAGGLAISSEAFFKASGKDVPDNIDDLLLNVESLFTPTIIMFLTLSSLFGLFKQSQLSSGATSYVELDKDADAE